MRTNCNKIHTLFQHMTEYTTECDLTKHGSGNKNDSFKFKSSRKNETLCHFRCKHQAFLL